MSARWTATDLPSLEGCTAVVTGANGGIGLVTARELARQVPTSCWRCATWGVGSRRQRRSKRTSAAVAAHPGYAATNLQSHRGNPMMNVMMGIGNTLFAQSDSRGALPTLFAATQDIAGDSYVGPDGFQEMRGCRRLVGRSSAAADRIPQLFGQADSS